MLQIARPISGTKLPGFGIRPPEHVPHQDLDGGRGRWPALPSAVLILGVDVAKGMEQTQQADFFLFRVSSIVPTQSLHRLLATNKAYHNFFCFLLK